MCNGTNNGNLVPLTAIQFFMGEKSFPHKISHPPDGDGVMGVQHVIDAECLIVVERTSIMMIAERRT